MRLDGKRVLITGASRGIGRAIAETFAAVGAHLILTSRTEAVEEVARTLASTGATVFSHRADLGDEVQLRALAGSCRQHLGGLDVLVNNAGVLLPGKLGMVRSSDARQMLETNLLAAVNLTQYAIRLMAGSQGASIINLASIAGTRGFDGMTVYSASKAAVVGFTLAAAKELAAQGIRVNAIAPGFIATEMTKKLGGEIERNSVSRIRLGRAGTPQDVAQCALFLASDLSNYITGQVIGVDGGMEA